MKILNHIILFHSIAKSLYSPFLSFESCIMGVGEVDGEDRELLDRYSSTFVGFDEPLNELLPNG